jgi:hypothetical protein
MPRGCIQLYCSFRSVSSPFITQRSSDTILTVADKDWSPRALRGYSAPSNVRRDRIAIILEHGTAVREVFMIYPAVLRGSLDRLDYTTADMTYTSSQWICAILQWPSSVTVTKISVRGYRDQKQSMEKLEDLLEYINENHQPWIWLETSSAKQSSLYHGNQPDFAHHPVLQLAAWVGTLADEDAEYATHLFALLRRNHRCSHDFVEDLTALFAPFRQLNTINSERSRSLIEIFEGQIETASHPSHLAKIESLAVELDGKTAEDARAVLYLIRRGFGTCRDYLDKLKVIFGPLQQRCVEELERAIQIKTVFEAIDEEAETICVG